MTIKLTALKAQVIGFWCDLYGQHKYLLRYADSTGRLADDWLPACELQT